MNAEIAETAIVRWEIWSASNLAEHLYQNKNS